MLENTICFKTNQCVCMSATFFFLLINLINNLCYPNKSHHPKNRSLKALHKNIFKRLFSFFFFFYVQGILPYTFLYTIHFLSKHLSCSTIVASRIMSNIMSNNIYFSYFPKRSTMDTLLGTSC